MFIIINKITNKITQTIDINYGIQVSENEQIQEITDEILIGKIETAYEYELIFTDGKVTDINVIQTLAEFQIPSLSDIQQQKILELSVKCEQEILEGFYSTARGINEWFTNSRDDQANVIAQASLCTLNPTIIPQWKSASESICTDFTSGQIIQLATDGALFKTERMKTFEVLKQQVVLCKAVECVGEISWVNYIW